ncbi:LysM peptidoglycan-binding domain-containing protein [bacterium]|nr:LysM peptidoglycan-binding domain-containing protein [bacterium]
MKIKMRLAFLLALVLLVMTPAMVSAQDATPNLEIHKINGKEYYIHTIEAGNTLYAVSRMYAIPIKELLKANPAAADGYAIGDRILIPLKEVKRKDFTQTVEVDGNYLIHKVEKKNTLYAISKEYDVDQKDIIAENPQVVDGLKEGMEIKIPVAKIKRTEEKQLYTPAQENIWQTHTVEPKETVYSLSKKYQVSIDSILAVNNGLVGGLRIGESVNIPLLKIVDTDTSFVPSPVFDSTSIKPAYKVALLLPFFLKENKEALEKENVTSADIFGMSGYALEFYEGFLIALDSLKKEGLNLKLFVFDTENDTAVTASILKKPEMKSLDLIVGPMYYKNFVKAADFAKKNQINIVSPVKQSNKILLGNSYVSKVATSSPLLVKRFADYCHSNWSKHNIILINHEGEEDDATIQTFLKSYKTSMLDSKDSTMQSVPNELIYGSKSFANLKNNLNELKMNVIYIPSENQAFITSLISSLHELKGDYRFTLVFNENVLNYDNLEIKHLHDLNVHALTSEFVDPEAQEVKVFKEQFFNRNKHLPSKFSYLGYDVGYFYLSLLNQFGVNYEVMFMGYNKEMLMMNFNFFKTGIESGYENHSVFLLKYEDYKLKKVF